MFYVWRVMSMKEYYNWRLAGTRGLFNKDGRIKRIVWFATDPGYINKILSKKVYMNKRIEDAYQIVVMFEVKLKREISVNFKQEHGYINVGIKRKYIDDVVLKEVFCWSTEEWIKKFRNNDSVLLWKDIMRIKSIKKSDEGYGRI